MSYVGTEIVEGEALTDGAASQITLCSLQVEEDCQHGVHLDPDRELRHAVLHSEKDAGSFHLKAHIW